MQSAVTVMFGGIGGILATATFRVQDAPRYIPGLVFSLFLGFILCHCWLIVFCWEFRSGCVYRLANASYDCSERCRHL